MHRILLLLFLLPFLACNDHNGSDPYADILNRPPFNVLTDSIEQFPGKDSLYFRRAVLLNTNNYPEPALRDFRKAWELGKNEEYALGVGTLMQDRRADSAILFLEEALREIPGSILLRLSLARAYDLAGKPGDAIRVSDEILAMEPRQVDVLKFKADLLHRAGKTPAAIETLERAYQLTPYDVELNYELAHHYAETGNPKVLRLCDSLIRQDNDSMNLHAEPSFFKGLYYANEKNYQEALDMFNEAILKNYYYLNAYIEKGRVQMELKDIPGALKTFQLALTLSPRFPDAYYWIGRCQEASGNKQEAKLNYQRAFSLDPEFTEAKNAADRLSR